MDDDDDDDDDDDATLLDNVQQMVFKAALLRVGPHTPANLPEWRREEHDDKDDTLSSAFISNDDKDDDAIVSAEYKSLCGDAMQRWMYRGKSFVVTRTYVRSGACNKKSATRRRR